MKFVGRQKLQEQKTSHHGKPLFLIYALDESGSMRGSKWNELMVAFKKSITTVQKMAAKDPQIKVSVMTFNEGCSVKYNFISPSSINPNIPYGNGGTDFSPVFQQAITMMQNHVSSYLVKFIFMTDGGS